MSQPRLILHLISELDGYGDSRQLRLLVEQQLANGHGVSVAAIRADQRQAAFFRTVGADFRVVERRWKYDPIAAWRLAKEYHRLPHDILHAWDLLALRYASFVRSRSRRAPCVATLAEEPCGRIKHAADCFAISHALDRETERTVVIPPGVESSSSQPFPRTKLLGRLVLPPDSCLIALAGKLTRSKRLEEAIWCFELVRTLDERAVLLIFGDGPDRQRLERFARLASDASKIRFLGFRDDLDCWLPQVDVFWKPEDEAWPTRFPRAIIEAMAARVPVIASDVPAHRRVIDEGRTGYLYPVGSRAIWARQTLRILADDKVASALTDAAAEEVADKFSTTTFSSAYEELYERLLANQT